MAAVCPDCISGFKDEGTPTGTVTEIGGLSTYVAKSTASGPSIVILPDVFGYSLANVRLIADKIAAKGISVYVPDVFCGDHIPHHYLGVMVDPSPSFFSRIGQYFALLGQIFTFISWVGRHKDDKVIPMIHKHIAALKAEHGVAKLGCMGYCWGGRHVVLLAGTDMVDCYVACHPSQLDVPKEVPAIKRPGLFVLAENDHAFNSSAVAKTKEMLDAKQDQFETTMITYPGTFHGFAVRGRQTEPVIAKAREDALNSQIEFFTKHLK